MGGSGSPNWQGRGPSNKTKGDLEFDFLMAGRSWAKKLN
jgi:hypothetical protein